LRPVFRKQFNKDLRRAERRGKDPEKLRSIIDQLLAGQPLDPRHRPHKLRGNWSQYWECHIEPDWLLIWKPEKDRLIFVRTGTHSDLFR